MRTGIWGIAAVIVMSFLVNCEVCQARTVQDFDFDWKFIKEDVPGAQAIEYDDSGWRDVQVPHDWSIEGPYSQEWASGTGFLPAGIGWYRKTFPVDPSLQGKIITVEFDGVYNNSDVWINGQHLGKRPFGYIGFEYDLTPHIIFGNENVIAVRVDHSKFADSRWYTGSGIYRHVRLNILDPVHIAHWGIYVTTPKVELPASASVRPSAEIRVETRLENKSGQMQSLMLFSRIYTPDGKLAVRLVSSGVIEPGKTKVFEQETPLSDVQLWDVERPNTTGKMPVIQYPSGRGAATSPYEGEESIKAGETPVIHSANAHGQAGLDRATRTNNTGETPVPLYTPVPPNMYTLKSVVKIGDKTVDEVETPFGIRTFAFDPNQGFTLNGGNIKLKGMCLHHDGGIMGAAVPEKMWVRRLEAMKEMGCNAIRCSHNPPSPEFLDLCDRMGFLVQDEAFDEFTPTKNKWVKGWNQGTPSRAGYGEVFEQWAQRDIADMVRRDRNHPSIIMWSIGNEVDYANDPFSHPVLGEEYKPDNPPAENLTKYGRMLVETVKQYDTTRPTTAALANAPMSNAVGFADILDVVGYNYQEKYYGEHHALYPERVLYGSENHATVEAWEAVEQNAFIAGQFVWTGIDYLGEAGAWPYRSWNRSPYDLCGFKKPSAWQRQSMWTDEPMVYIACRPTRGSEGQRSGRGNRAVWPNWKAEQGQMMEVQAFTNCDEVELALNGRSLGAKPYAEAVRRMLVWRVPFEAGALTAVARKGGQVCARGDLSSYGAPAAVELVCGSNALAADGKDVCLVEFRVVDEKGVLAWDADNEVSFEITGPARIIGIGNGDATAHQSHQGSSYKVYQGKGLMVLRAERKAGTVTIEAKSEGLAPARTVLTTECTE
ncbi:MAG: DUF4982 domain-containing protein [Planctomycetaceae bacterium]|nr:DUF4982 domain-containing protein [Planctomycetaceae bacterium]